MGALYEDVENFFGDIFAWYGRKVAHQPLIFILVPFVTCCLLGLGLFNIEYETDLENLYTPVNSRALRDRKLLREAFDNNGGVGGERQFYAHQAVDRPDYVELIIRARGLHTVTATDSEEGGDAEAEVDGSGPASTASADVGNNGTDEVVSVLSDAVLTEVSAGWICQVSERIVYHIQ
jgi:hypothetical protein